MFRLNNLKNKYVVVSRESSAEKTIENMRRTLVRALAAANRQHGKAVQGAEVARAGKNLAMKVLTLLALVAEAQGAS